MNQSQQPKALRLAAFFDDIFISEEVNATTARKVSAELRRLHTRVQELETNAQRAPMTDAEIESATGAKQGTPLFLAAKGFTIAIERAHGIGKEEKE